MKKNKSILYPATNTATLLVHPCQSTSHHHFLHYDSSTYSGRWCNQEKCAFINYAITGLDRPVGLQEFEAPAISRQSAQDGGEVASPTHQPPFQPPPPNEISLALISVGGRVETRITAVTFFMIHKYHYHGNLTLFFKYVMVIYNHPEYTVFTEYKTTLHLRWCPFHKFKFWGVYLHETCLTLSMIIRWPPVF